MGRKKHRNVDARDRRFADVGWKPDGVGGFRQHRFYFGKITETTLDQFEARRARIRELLAHSNAGNGNGRLVWTGQTLEFAMQLAKGQSTIVVGRTAHQTPDLYTLMLRNLADRFPMLIFKAEDDDALEEGEQFYERAYEHRLKEMRRDGVVSDATLLKHTDALLHDAFDAYIGHINEEQREPGAEELSDYGIVRVENTERLKEHHANVPISTLDSFDSIQRLVTHWRNRPHRKGTTRPIAKKTAEHHVRELIRFFKWLHRSGDFNWRKPEDFEELDTKVKVTGEERKAQGGLRRVKVFNMDELVLLNRYATPLERLLLLLGLNCGMAGAEQGRLAIADVFLDQLHPDDQLIDDWESNESDSYIVTGRGKTGTFGTWLLWQQTRDVIDWAIKRRQSIDKCDKDSVLLVSERGKPFFSKTSGKYRSKRFDNTWRNLVDRVRVDHPDFPKLSFGKAKKTGSNLVRTDRQKGSGELATLLISHGAAITRDDLLECYSNHPYGRLFDCLRHLEDKLKPVFDAVSEPTSQPKQQYVSLGTEDRIMLLHREGKSVREIASEVGVSRMTVHRRIKAASEASSDR